MQLLEVEAFDAQVMEALLRLTANRVRARVDVPLVGAGSVVTGLGCDDETVRVGRERFADEALARLVGCGRIDEVHIELDRAAQYALARLGVGRVAPDTRSGDPHRAVSHSIDREVADDEGSRAGCRLHAPQATAAFLARSLLAGDDHRRRAVGPRCACVFVVARAAE